MIYAGIDSGSRTVKIALWNSETHSVMDTALEDQGIHQERIALSLLHHVLQRNQLTQDRIQRIIATGYGRNNIRAAHAAFTEITCHAAGARHFLPQTRTVIDIGGQDSKYIRLSEQGAVEDFAMNDRCAAGTGCFLEMIARRLDLDLDQMGPLAIQSSKPALVSSMCAVFAETEIIGLLVGGASLPDIIAGVQQSIASRISSMIGQTITPPIVLTGGVALVPGIVHALSDRFKLPVQIAPHPQMVGAVGAAILASQS